MIAALACAYQLSQPCHAPVRAPVVAQVEGAFFRDKEAEVASNSVFLKAAGAAGAMTALIAAPDITSVDQMSYYAWPTAFVALPVALFWLLPFFLASDVIDGGIALQSGLLAATARRSP